MKLPQPSVEVVSEYSQWFEREGYGATERAVTELFQTFPHNVRLEAVLVKVAALNDLYNTNIYAVYDMARHIWELDMDSRLEQGSLDLVEEIAIIVVGGKRRRNYSFATKYCSFHVPEVYPVYDGYVEEALWAYKKRDRFARFKRKDLWESYPQYVTVVKRFREYYGLGGFGLREIDRFLWLTGMRLRGKR
ncbi:MAG TPA: hypothetical protein ENI39_01405 [Anaerolineae bacterium]|nr:hypothetical protein [Anaerolineae bacterium]